MTNGIDSIATPFNGREGGRRICALGELRGLATIEAQRLVRGLRGVDFISADVVEVAPPVDASAMTALAGVSIMFEILCVLAERVALLRNNGGDTNLVRHGAGPRILTHYSFKGGIELQLMRWPRLPPTVMIWEIASRLQTVEWKLQEIIGND